MPITFLGDWAIACSLAGTVVMALAIAVRSTRWKRRVAIVRALSAIAVILFGVAFLDYEGHGRGHRRGSVNSWLGLIGEILSGLVCVSVGATESRERRVADARFQPSRLALLWGRMTCEVDTGRWGAVCIGALCLALAGAWPLRSLTVGLPDDERGRSATYASWVLLVCLVGIGLTSIARGVLRRHAKERK